MSLRARQWGAFAALSAVAAITVGTSPTDMLAAGAAAGLVGAAVGLTRRSLPVLTVSRGVAWLTFSVLGLASLGSLLFHVSWDLLAVTALSGIAWWLSRAALHTDEAKRAFAPIAYRNWFLSMSSAQAGVGALLLFCAVGCAKFGGPLPDSAILAAIGGAQVASSAATVRMRGWGVLLGALIGGLTIGSAMLMHDHDVRWACALGGLPGLGLLLPILHAKLGLRRDAPEARTRVELGAPIAAGPRLESAGALDERADESESEESLRDWCPPAHVSTLNAP